MQDTHSALSSYFYKSFEIRIRPRIRAGGGRVGDTDICTWIRRARDCGRGCGKPVGNAQPGTKSGAKRGASGVDIVHAHDQDDVRSSAVSRPWVANHGTSGRARRTLRKRPTRMVGLFALMRITWTVAQRLDILKSCPSSRTRHISPVRFPSTPTAS